MTTDCICDYCPRKGTCNKYFFRSQFHTSVHRLWHTSLINKKICYLHIRDIPFFPRFYPYDAPVCLWRVGGFLQKNDVSCCRHFPFFLINRQHWHTQSNRKIPELARSYQTFRETSSSLSIVFYVACVYNLLSSQYGADFYSDYPEQKEKKKYGRKIRAQTAKK